MLVIMTKIEIVISIVHEKKSIKRGITVGNYKDENVGSVRKPYKCF